MIASVIGSKGGRPARRTREGGSCRNRVRISVRKGLLKPDDVSVLYFEPKGSAVAIHDMTLDEHGNLLAAPEGYRDFFMKETDKLLGFAD